MGFDTEYDSNTTEPLTAQLSFQGKEHYEELHERITTEHLGAVAEDMTQADPGDTVYLATYWSPAELGTMAAGWWMQGRVVPVNGQGVFNLEWLTDSGVKVCLYDLFHWFDPKPLKDVALAFGMKKLDWDRKHVSRESLRKPGFRAYAMNDAHLAEGIIHGLCREMRSRGIDPTRSRTPASASMRAYREHYLTAEVRQQNYALRRLSMKANLGGLGEAYVHADLDGDFVQIDADSLYPTAVLELSSFPVRTEDWHVLRHKERPPRDSEGICKVRFSFPPGFAYPSLPVVQQGLGMCYPLNGISYCTVAEARVAEDFGAKVDYWAGWWYDPAHGDDSFQRYLGKLLTEKRALDKGGDRVKRIASKFLLNAGIGKFSQRRGADLEDLKKLSRQEGIPLEVVAGPGFKHPDKIKRSQPGDSWMPEWHALILGKARSLMFPYMKVTSCLMTITDSILTAREKADRASDDPTLTWKLEGESRHIRIIRQRLYAMEGAKVAHHAVHKRGHDARRLMMAVPLGKRVTYKARKRYTLLDAIAHKGQYGAPRLRSFTYSSEWSGKRKLHEDGTTEAWQDMEAWKTWKLTQPA